MIRDIHMDKTEGISGMPCTRSSLSDAFILYNPHADKQKENVFFNETAAQIISFALDPVKKPDPSAEILSLCSKWKQLADKNRKSTYIAVIRSWRRRYSVRGIPLSGNGSSKENEAINYLFILERFSQEKINVSRTFRELKLSQREQDIVHLLLSDKSNKEIAAMLGLSLNTIKGYMKLLMRKLGASSRAGIVVAILADS